jgi:hypothetical protein
MEDPDKPAQPEAANAPSPPPPRLEVLVIRGIDKVAHGTDHIQCHAAVLTPEAGFMTSMGKSVICDRVLRFYDASTAIKSHRPIAEGGKATLRKQSQDVIHLLVDGDVYTIHAPSGKRLDVKWGDFNSMSDQPSMALRQAINKYVLTLLKKPV